MNFIKRVFKDKVSIALVIMWAVLLAFLVIKTYWISYNTSNRLMHDVPLLPGYDLKRLESWDLAIIVVSGIVISLFLSDVEKMFYAYIATIILTFIISVTYISLYIWYVLDFGSLFSIYAYDWELAVYAATMISFVLMVPWMVSFCLVGVAIGAFLKTLIGKH